MVFFTAIMSDLIELKLGLCNAKHAGISSVNCRSAGQARPQRSMGEERVKAVCGARGFSADYQLLTSSPRLMHRQRAKTSQIFVERHTTTPTPTFVLFVADKRF